MTVRENQSRMPVVEALENFISGEHVPLHMPGHKGRTVMTDSWDLRWDVTELEGLDDLHMPEGIILEAEELAADLFGADETLFLVNGTTSGIMAAMAAVAGDGELIIAAGDCHESVTRGFVMSGAMPLYLFPHFDVDNCVAGGISPDELERILKMGAEARAVILTHPSYFGTGSDLLNLVRVAHRHGVPVIVDEAHGAQAAFADTGVSSALSCGADLVIQSTHKMLGSMTQTSMLHMQGQLVDRRRVRYFAGMMQSTSPSYPLMASLDFVRAKMAAEGREMWNRIVDLTEKTRDRIDEIRGFRCLRTYEQYDGVTAEIEKTRLIIDPAECGLSGTELEEILRRDFGIWLEFADQLYAVALSGAGTVPEDMSALTSALQAISDSRRKQDPGNTGSTGPDRKTGTGAALRKRLYTVRPERVMSPRKAVMGRGTMTDLRYAEGMIAAAAVSVYPPGIPFLRPGERITAEICRLAADCIDAGYHLHGAERRETAGGTVYYIPATMEDGHRAVFSSII